MRAEEFSVGASGELLTIEGGLAFVPRLLPPDYTPSTDLLMRIAHVRGALGEFVGEARQARNETLILRPLQTSEAVLSSQIEGIHTDVADVLLHDSSQGRKDPSGPVGEVLRYISALRKGSELVADGWPLSLALIRELQRELLEGLRGGTRALGVFRQRQVYIGSPAGSSIVERIEGARFVPPPAEQVPPLMDNFAEYLATPSRWDPLIECAFQHYQFEAIHPFEDGNGRTGRILIPLFLVSRGVLVRPNLYLSPYFDAHHDEYIDLLKRVSTHGDWESWVRFFVDGVEMQAVRSRERVRALFDLVDDYKERVRANPRSRPALAAIDLVAERVVVTVRDLVTYANVTYPTARSYLDRLTEMGILESRRDAYPAYWIARELLEQVYTA